MIDLKITRDKIDKIDKELVNLFEQRMALTKDVAEYKIATGKAIYDKEREDAKKKQVAAYAASEQGAKDVDELFTQIMTISRRSQYQQIAKDTEKIDEDFMAIKELPITKSTRVAYQGVPGAYSEQAMYQFFGENIKAFHVAEFKDVMTVLDEGKAEYGVLPIENSSAGTVAGIYDLLAHNHVNIVGEVVVEVNQALLVVPGTKEEQITTVYSHPQGLMQCSRYLEEKGWQLRSLANTAVSAQKVHEDQDMSQAAIASERAASLYELEVLHPCLNNTKQNATRFIVLSKEKMYVENAEKISISFGLPHESGTLYNVLMHFAYNNLSMTKIESRPLEGKRWEYRFFVDFTGNLSSNEVQNALKAIRAESIEMHILGNY